MEGRHGLVKGNIKVEDSLAQAGHKCSRRDQDDDGSIEVKHSASTACGGRGNAIGDVLGGHVTPGGGSGDEEHDEVEK